MKITVGKGSCGLAAGAGEVYAAFERLLKQKPSAFNLHTTGCIGLCYLEPLVNVSDEGGVITTYVKVTPEIAEAIAGGRPPDGNILSGADAAVLTRQTRIALRHCGLIDPEDIGDYKNTGGYAAYRCCTDTLTPVQVIDAIKSSGLAGRGGAGFPTWFKWDALRTAEGTEKYLVCNADEGDPGAFMDRAILESDPHSVIEGMLIAAYATGASHGVIYVRAEYPLAIQRLETALSQARTENWLGGHFDIRIKAGAGAFVCGEETALIASLQGERGMPRLKPPYPAQQGYRRRPTNINNVETYANVPWVMAGEYPAKANTKVFALTGKVNNGGLVEIPLGHTLREVIFDIGGGLRGGQPVKAVQLGGPSGGCIPERLLDTPINYQSLSATGAIMGSGGMVVMDGDTCMVEMARFFLDFIVKESCGKCTHCRIGTKRMLEILTRITQGQGAEGDIEKLETLARHIRDGALCGLGSTAPNPVLTTLAYFRAEYEDHIHQKHCAAGQCAALRAYRIRAGRCRGCGLCAQKCPVSCIAGQKGQAYGIDARRCIKCGVCEAACKFGAVTHKGKAVDDDTAND